MRGIGYFLIGLLLLAGASSWAQPGGPGESRRVALVVGNSAYPSGALENPRNDAGAVAESLKKLGFEVELKIDATKADFDAARKRFGIKAEKAEVAALFYAGHGMQESGFNYLVPIDARPKTARDLKWEMVRLDDLIDDMGSARVKLVFFDACRDNPLARSFSRGGSRGLAPPLEASGTMISFATKHGNTASDGDGKHSPYTQALLAELENPVGIEIEVLLKKVSQSVKKNTRGEQEPWKYGSLDGDFYLVQEAAKDGARPAQAGPVDVLALEQEYWSHIKASREIDDFNAYLHDYPAGAHAAQARLLISQLKREQSRSTAVAPAAAAPAPVAVATPVQPAAAAGAAFRDCSAGCPEMLIVPGGSFLMGSPPGEVERLEREGPQHAVKIAGFALGKYAVTFAEWDACIAAGGCTHNPDDVGWGRGRRPVVKVSWEDARQYVEWLAKKTGLGYRLPSEAEWEYAARAGTTTPFNTGNCINTSQANYNGNYDYADCGAKTWNFREKTVAVGTYPANAFGLHEMHGNVWQWIADCWNDSYSGAPADGNPWLTGDCKRRVVRGGSWDDYPTLLRSARRYWGGSGGRYMGTGFRVARALNAAGR